MSGLRDRCPGCSRRLITTRFDTTFRLPDRSERLCFGIPGGLCEDCHQLYIDPELIELLDLGRGPLRLRDRERPGRPGAGLVLRRLSGPSLTRGRSGQPDRPAITGTGPRSTWSITHNVQASPSLRGVLPRVRLASVSSSSARARNGSRVPPDTGQDAAQRRLAFTLWVIDHVDRGPVPVMAGRSV